MAKTDITKMAFADALRQLVKQKPYAGITVHDISTMAGLSRHTFYYHFLDKRDLVSWLFTNNRHKFMKPINKDNFRNNYLRTLQYMQEDSTLYSQALQDESQNGFREHYYSIMVKDYITLIESYIGERSLLKQDIEFFAHFFAAGTVETAMDFIENPKKEAPETVTHRVCVLQESGLYQTIDKLLKDKETK